MGVALNLLSPLVVEKGIHVTWLASLDSNFSLAEFITGAREILEREGFTKCYFERNGLCDPVTGASEAIVIGERTVSGPEAARHRVRNAYHASALRVWVDRLRALAKGHRYDWYEPRVGS